jgi:hypothetical protein
MLTIISGVQTIHKQFFARKILLTTNNFNAVKFEEFKVDFTKEIIEVYDANNELVYRPESDDTLGVDQLISNDKLDRFELYKKIDLFYDDFLAKIQTNHFKHTFLDILYDYGIKSTLTLDGLLPTRLPYPATYNDIIQNYTAGEYRNYVITGCFSKGFIDKLRNDLGPNQIQVINLIRNPSVCALLHKKNTDQLSGDAVTTAEEDIEALNSSLLNAVNLKRFPDIHTIRFEDFLKDGHVTINGQQYDLPKQYVQHNQYITQFEKDNLATDDITSYNEMYSNLNSNFYSYKDPVLSEQQFNELTSTTDFVAPQLPTNLFEELGYTPLSYLEIVS